MIAHAVVAGFAIFVMVIGGGRFVGRTWDQTVELMPVTLGQLYLVLPLAGVIIALYSASHIVDTIRRPLHVRTDEEIAAALQEEAI